MVKLFFVTHTYSLGGGGGSEAFVSGFLKMLSKDNEIFVFAPNGRHYKEQEKKYNIKVYRTPVFGHHAFHKFQQQLFKDKAVKLAKDFKAEIIHAQNDVLSGLIAEKIKKKTNANFLLNIEYLSEQNASINMKIVFLLNKLFLPKLSRDFTVCWSKHVAEKYLKPWGFKESEIEIIPGAIDTELFKPGINASDLKERFGEKIIVSAKPLHATNAKGIENTIKAMPYVFKEFPDYKFVVFGYGTHKKLLEETVKKMGLEKKILFPGELKHSEVPKAYAAATLVVHSFAFEATTSIALLESMSAEKPVIVTSTGEIARVVGNTGYLVPPMNPKKMAEKIIHVLQNPREAQKKARLARKKVLEHYSLKKTVERFKKIYNMLA